MITVLLADDQDMVRGGFRLILDAEPGIEVVAEAGDGRQAVELARRHRPDVVLMDIRMPVLVGLEASRRLLAGPSVSSRCSYLPPSTPTATSTTHSTLAPAGSC